jgi:hypothetical protein
VQQGSSSTSKTANSLTHHYFFSDIIIDTWTASWLHLDHRGAPSVLDTFRFPTTNSAIHLNLALSTRDQRPTCPNSMAAPDVLSADAVAPRLDYLLQRARVVKAVTSIDPPLQVSELVPENEPLLGKIEGGDQVRTLAVESAAKSVFYANLVSHYAIFPVPEDLLTRLGLNSN